MERIVEIIKAKHSRYGREEIEKGNYHLSQSISNGVVGLSQALLAGATGTGCYLLTRNEFGVNEILAITGALAAAGATLAMGRLATRRFIRTFRSAQAAHECYDTGIAWAKLPDDESRRLQY